MTQRTWIAARRPAPATRVTQVYAFALDDRLRLVVLRDASGRCTLPGGKPEATDQGAVATLRRECLEEGQVLLRAVRYLGHVEVDDGDRRPYAQLRYLARVEAFLPTAPDVATGETYTRLLVPLHRANDFLRWGDHGAAQVRSAVSAVAEGDAH